MAKFKPGDKVIYYRDGVTYALKKDSSHPAYPLSIPFRFGELALTEDGKNHIDDVNPMIFHPEDYPNELARPVLVLDANIYVRDSAELEWQLQHFKAWSEDGINRIVCFSDGRTSWSGSTGIKWRLWKLPTEEDLK